MQPIRLVGLLLVVYIGTIAPVHARWRSPPDRIELASVPELEFVKDRKTVGRRSAPMDQVVVVGGNAKGTEYVPTYVKCTNLGLQMGGHAIKWQCTTELPNIYTIHRSDVSCEGYDKPGDEYILKGSCAVLLHLDTTRKDAAPVKKTSPAVARFTVTPNPSGEAKGSAMLVVFFILGILFIVLCTCEAMWQSMTARPVHVRVVRARSPPTTPPVVAVATPPPYVASAPPAAQESAPHVSPAPSVVYVSPPLHAPPTPVVEHHHHHTEARGIGVWDYYWMSQLARPTHTVERTVHHHDARANDTPAPAASAVSSADVGTHVDAAEGTTYVR